MDDFLKASGTYVKDLRDIHAYFHSVFWPSYLHSRVNPYTPF